MNKSDAVLLLTLQSSFNFFLLGLALELKKRRELHFLTNYRSKRSPGTPFFGVSPLQAAGWFGSVPPAGRVSDQAN